MSRPLSSGEVEVSADSALLERLRDGSEEAFGEVVDRYGPAMLRVATLYVRDRSLAQEIVQDAWVNVLRGLDRFEGRSSLRTWIFVILGNCARRRAQREQRTIPFADPHEPSLGASVDPDHFFPATHPRWPGAWSTVVEDWRTLPQDHLASAQATAAFRAAIAELPARYAVVITLRDIEDWSADEVCTLLEISAENQRVLLHRARARVRASLVEYFGSEAA
ncbi:MAG: polymerase sigma-70 factor, subfamily [Gaiellaceae bacterium]|jgi:RNA polymerase sigma-70 factor (ECF subfamily)|nr:polymerase sigma-70 factor, subfamily [Gaiellaceae bacterium]